MSDSYAESSQTMTTFKVAVEAAIAATISNVKNVTGLCNFNLSVTASAAELDDMYQKRHHRYVNIASHCIPYRDRNGSEQKAPVTPLYGPVKDQTFHTITMCRTDGVTVVVLVRDCDNYVVGFRIYMNEAEANNAPWLVFRGAELPPSLGNVVGIQYHFAYETIEDIKFEKNTLADIVEFLISFRTNPNQSTTVSGKLLIGSLFLLFGEAQRFCAARKWILCALLCSTPQNIPKNIADIFRKWSDLSKICLELYLAMLEKHYLGSSDGRINDALKNWKKVENANRSTVLKFRDLQNNIHLNCLLGGEVYLLKHDFEFCTRIVMLQLGYRKDLKIKKCNIKKVYAKSMANKFCE